MGTDQMSTAAQLIDLLKAVVPPTVTALAAVLVAVYTNRRDAKAAKRRSEGGEEESEPSKVIERVNAHDPQSMEDAIVHLARMAANFDTRLNAQASEHKQQMEQQASEHKRAMDELRLTMQRQIDKASRRVKQLIAVLEENNIPIPPELADEIEGAAA